MMHALAVEDDIAATTAESAIIAPQISSDTAKKFITDLRKRMFPGVGKQVELRAEEVKKQFSELHGEEFLIRPTDDGGPRRVSQLGGSKVFRSMRRRG